MWFCQHTDCCQQRNRSSSRHRSRQPDDCGDRRPWAFRAETPTLATADGEWIRDIARHALRQSALTARLPQVLPRKTPTVLIVKQQLSSRGPQFCEFGILTWGNQKITRTTKALSRACFVGFAQVKSHRPRAGSSSQSNKFSENQPRANSTALVFGRDALISVHMLVNPLHSLELQADRIAAFLLTAKLEGVKR